MTLPALAGLTFGRLWLDPKLTAGDRLSRPPDLLGCWSKIEQELELSEGVEADVVEEANRRRVPRHRTRYQLPYACRACFGDDALGQLASNASATPALADDDRLELGVALVFDQPGHPDYLVSDCREPDPLRAYSLEMLIELAAGIGSADLWAVIEVSVPPRQLYP